MPAESGIEKLEDIVDKLYDMYPTEQARAEFVKKIRKPKFIASFQDIQPNFHNANLPLTYQIKIYLAPMKYGIGEFFDVNNKLNINKTYFVDANRVEFKKNLVHEVVHAIQPFKKTSAKYKEMVTKGHFKSTYYNERVEVEAYLAQIAYELQKTFFSLSPAPYNIYYGRSKRQLFLYEFEQWLKNENYNFSTIVQYNAIFYFWRKSNKIWREVKQKLYRLYLQLYKKCTMMPSGDKHLHYNINADALKQIRKSPKYPALRYK